MPTYEYTCDACGKAWEKEQRISENAIRECPHCGAMEARRLVSSGNFILKGSGWYADLYSKPAPAKGGGEAKAEGGEAPKGDAPAKDAPAKGEAGTKADKAEKAPAKPAASSSGDG